jgi:hypothetical protein
VAGRTFTAYGSSDDTSGIVNSDGWSTLEADLVVAIVEGPGYYVRGLHGRDGPIAALRGGSYSGRDGEHINGIRTDKASSAQHNTPTAHGATAIARNGSVETYGLDVRDEATAVVSQSTLDGDDTGAASGADDPYANGVITLTHVHLIGGPAWGDVTWSPCRRVARAMPAAVHRRGA